MWPKCCPSFKSATWDQDHFTHPYFVSGFRPALLAFKGWPTERIPPIFFSSKTSFVRVLLLGQLLFPHASRHEWGISGTWGGPEYSWRAGMHLSWVNASSLSVSLSPCWGAHTVQSQNHAHTRSARTCSIPASTYSSHASLLSFRSKAHAHYIQQNTHTHIHSD